jgi:hypothetical protein
VFKPLRILNLTLGLVAALIAVALAGTWVAPLPTVLAPSASNPSQDAAAVAFNRIARPPLAHYEPLAERSPFKQPPPPPPPRAVPPPAAVPPRPLPTLSGTILVGDEWKAILSDKGKADIYTIGQEVGGGVITEIREDRVVLRRGDSPVEVLLKAAIESGAPQAGQPEAAGLSAPATPVTSLPAAAPMGKAAEQYDKELRKQQKKAEKGQRKLLRQQLRNQ